mgnify:CR=1 FL=1
MQDHALININGNKVGVTGLKQALEEAYAKYGESFSEQELGSFLLEKLKRQNYIPAGTEQEHIRAFLREYRKYAGLPAEEEKPSGLEIKVYGPGCSRCDQLEQRIYEILSELNLAADVEHVRDPREIAKAGIMGTPGLQVNDKVVAVGKVPGKEELKGLLQE